MITTGRAERFSYAARSNEVICPFFQKCGNSGTFIRHEIYKDLKFGQKDAGKVLNQRAEQCRRVNYEQYVQHFASFEQVYAREFAPRFNKKRGQIPPAFTERLVVPVKSLTIEVTPRVSCADASLIIFVKTSRVHFFERKVIRLVVAAMDPTAVVFFVLGNGTTAEVTRQVTQESDMFGDLIVVAFPDDYENLPLKTQTAYQYGSANCNPGKGAHHLVKMNPATLIVKNRTRQP